MDQAQFNQIIDNLQQNKIRKLDLRGQDISIDQMKTLANVLICNASLQSLGLAATYLNAESMQYLCEALKVNKYLRSLDLSWNFLNTENMQYLCDALKANSTLQSLNLDHNDLLVASMQHLCDALKVNTVLQRLSLFCVKLNQDTMPLLCDALKSNRSLQSLELGGNHLKSAIMEPLYDALKNHQNLQWLALQGNDLEQQLKEQMQQTLLLNSKLRLDVIAITTIFIQAIRGDMMNNGKLNYFKLLPLDLVKYILEILTKDIHAPFRSSPLYEMTAQEYFHQKLMITAKDGKMCHLPAIVKRPRLNDEVSQLKLSALPQGLFFVALPQAAQEHFYKRAQRKQVKVKMFNYESNNLEKLYHYKFGF